METLDTELQKLCIPRGGSEHGCFINPGLTKRWLLALVSPCGSFLYPLVNIQKTMERSTIFNGKIHYFYVPCSIAMLNYQRVQHVIGESNENIGFNWWKTSCGLTATDAQKICFWWKIGWKGRLYLAAFGNLNGNIYVYKYQPSLNHQFIQSQTIQL